MDLPLIPCLCDHRMALITCGYLGGSRRAAGLGPVIPI